MGGFVFIWRCEFWSEVKSSLSHHSILTQKKKKGMGGEESSRVWSFVAPSPTKVCYLVLFCCHFSSFGCRFRCWNSFCVFESSIWVFFFFSQIDFRRIWSSASSNLEVQTYLGSLNFLNFNWKTIYGSENGNLTLKDFFSRKKLRSLEYLMACFGLAFLFLGN